MTIDDKSNLEGLARALMPLGKAPLATSLAGALRRAHALCEGKDADASETFVDVVSSYVERGIPDRLARIAYAALPSDADAQLQDLLRELSGNTFEADATTRRLGSVGHALRSRVLDGLEVSGPQGSLRVEWLVPFYQKQLGRGGADAAIKIRRGESERIVHIEVGQLPWMQMSRCVLTGWKDVALSRMTEAIGQDAHALQDRLLPNLIDSLLEPIESAGLVRWVLERASSVLVPTPAEPMVVTNLRDVEIRVWLNELVTERAAGRDPGIKATVRLDILSDGELVDVWEQELYWGAFDEADYDAPWPADEGPARAAAQAWREAVQRFVQTLPVDPRQLMPHDILDTSPIAFLTLALREGPPPPRTVTPRLSWTKASVASRLRRIDGEALTALRSGVDDQTAAAYAIDGWTVLFSPFHRKEKGTFQADRIQIIPPGREVMPILMGDPWNGHVMPLDGDADLFRAFSLFWRELLQQAALDAEYEVLSDDEEDFADDEISNAATQNAPVKRSITDWLTFPQPGLARFPTIDWRLQGEDDFIASFSFSDAGPFGFSLAQQEVHRQSVAEYHRFIREVIDPAFRR